MGRWINIPFKKTTLFNSIALLDTSTGFMNKPFYFLIYQHKHKIHFNISLQTKQSYINGRVNV